MNNRQRLNEFSQKFKVAVNIHIAQTSESVSHDPTWNGFMTVQHPAFSETFRVILKSYTGTKKVAQDKIIELFMETYSIEQMKQVLIFPICKNWSTLASGIQVHKIVDKSSKVPHAFGKSSNFLFVDLEGFVKNTFQVLTIIDESSDVLYVHPNAVTVVAQLLQEKTVVFFDSRLDIMMLHNVNVQLKNVIDLMKKVQHSIGGRYWGLKTLTSWISKVHYQDLPTFKKKNMEWWTDDTLCKYAVADVVAIRLCYLHLCKHRDF
jgi:hypothetical protein